MSNTLFRRAVPRVAVRGCVHLLVSVVALMAARAPSARADQAVSPDDAEWAGILDGRTGDTWSESGHCHGLMSPIRDRLEAAAVAEYPIDLCGAGIATEESTDPLAEACPVPSAAGSGCCGDVGDEHPSRRFYITGIIGASFATLQSGGVNTAGDFPNTGRAAANLLTAGGALGTAIDRDAGLLRLEVEGRGRDLLTGQTNSFQPPTPTFFYSVRAADGWSVMANAWREWYLNDRLGFYGGGGIGAGGYRLTVDDGVVSGYGHVGGFAWQAGTGTTLRLTQRTTLDLGYRFFDTVSDGLPLTISGTPVSGGNYQSNFYASELLLSVRIYEPFRDRPGR